MKELRLVSLKSRRAAVARRDLLLALGAKCCRCGLAERLQFDCIAARGRGHHLMSWPERVRFYWAEYLAGNLQLLCAKCHQKKTSSDNCKAKGLTLIFVRPSIVCGG